MPGKTLQELDGVDWNEPSSDTYLVKTCHGLRNKPLEELTVEDLRIMIGHVNAEPKVQRVP